MSSLLGSLGLDKAKSVNDMPDNTYQGVIDASYIAVKDDGTVSHVIACRVTEGSYSGGKQQRWQKLGNNPQRDSVTNKLVGFDSTMNEDNLKWYKQMWLDLGVPESVVDAGPEPEILKGKTITFGVKTKDGYQNVNWLRVRNVPGQAQPQTNAQGQADPWATPPPAATPAATPPATDTPDASDVTAGL